MFVGPATETAEYIGLFYLRTSLDCCNDSALPLHLEMSLAERFPFVYCEHFSSPWQRSVLEALLGFFKVVATHVCANSH